MPLKIRVWADGSASVTGQKASFLKYEKAIQTGKISCGLQAMFKDSRHRSVGYRYPEHWETTDPGKVVHIGLIPLTPTGKPKRELFP
jgi:hypothetical protein